MPGQWIAFASCHEVWTFMVSQTTCCEQATAEVAPEEAIRALQTMLPAPPRAPLEPVRLENVSPALLLPPSGGAVTAALAGGQFELGDRVACLRGTGTPPLGLRGSVVGARCWQVLTAVFDPT